MTGRFQRLKSPRNRYCTSSCERMSLSFDVYGIILENQTLEQDRQRMKVHPRRSIRSKPTIWMQVICMFAFTFRLSVGEQEVDDNTNNEYLNKNISEADREEEWYMIILFSLLFGFFVTLFAAFVAYFSIKEDLLMRHYEKEGISVLADVVSAGFVRSRGEVGLGGNQKVNAEYAAFVEYDELLRDDFKVRIRKQVKVLDTDFVNKSLMPWKDSAEKTLPSSYITSNAKNKQQKLAEATSTPHSVVDTTCNRRYVELYVLPSCPKSGYPAKQVERATGIKHRLSTVALVVFDILLAAFCIHLASDALEDLQDLDERRYGAYAIAIFSILFLLELPMIHCVLGSWFSAFLHEEYVENGDFLIRDDDQSTLSSGSDMYLSHLSTLESQCSVGLGSSLSKLSVPHSFV